MAVGSLNLDIGLYRDELRVFDPEAIVRERTMAEARQTQELILRGSNSITYDGPNGTTVVLEIPKWREQPIGRLRIAWARWRYQRSFR